MFKRSFKKRTPGKPKQKRHRSKFETAFNEFCKANGHTLGYETSVLPFVTSPQKRKYHPDWTIREGWYIETKGRLDAKERQKLIYIKQQHPKARILVVFQRFKHKIYKASKTSYWEWCDKQGIEWCGIEHTDRILSFIKEAMRKDIQ